jgi:hypothetical protein
LTLPKPLNRRRTSSSSATFGWRFALSAQIKGISLHNVHVYLNVPNKKGFKTEVMKPLMSELNVKLG